MRLIADHLNKNHKLLKHSLLMFIGAMAVNVLNYFYQLFMGRMLGPEDYGILGALFSLVYIVTFSFGTIRTVIARFTTEYYTKKRFGAMKALMLYALEKLFLFGFLWFMAFLLVSLWLSSFLRIEYVLLAITGLFLFFSLLGPVPLGMLHGMQKFGSFTFLSILATLLKLGFGILLVVLGFRVAGAMTGLAIAQVLSLVISLLFLVFLFKHEKQPIGHSSLFAYSVPVFFGLTLMNVLVNVDVLFVKHYFPSLEAGYYTAASMIGKAILFSSSIFLMVMFPKVSEQHEANEDTKKLLKATLFYTAIISFGAVFIYFMVPTFISHLLFGPEYEIASYVALFGLAIALFSMSNVLVTYNFALKETDFVYGLLGFFVVEILGFLLFHQTLKEILQVVLVVNVLVLVYMLFVVRKPLGFNML